MTMKALAAILNKRGKNAVNMLVSMLNVLGRTGTDTFCIATQDDITLNSSLEKLSIQGIKSSTALGHVFLKVVAADKPKLLQFGKSAFVFDGRVYSPATENLETVLAQKFQAGNVLTAAETLIKEFDGCFAFAMVENGKLVAGRDALGTYPLYYGENSDFFAVASECKALRKIGITRAKSFPPGHVLITDKQSFKIKRVKTPSNPVKSMSVEEAVDKVHRLLLQSTAERTACLDKVAVAFSGGLDSSLTAFLIQKTGIDVHLIHVSLESQIETSQAEEVARLLDLPFNKFLYSVEEVERDLPKILWCVEIPDPLQVSIGIPVFWAAEKAAELGFGVLFAGQGADELFGGYRRYLTLYTRFGEDFAEKAIISDILKMYENNFERDFKVCNYHNIELRLPFASYPLVELAMGLPLNLKIVSKSDMLRKFVLRKTAEKLGLPKQIICKPKKAIQYATGVDKTLKKLAKKHSLSLKRYLVKIFKESFGKTLGGG
ncbi:MAG: asparagine synthetase B [Candidatus Bathyarchaeia archaeon]